MYRSPLRKAPPTVIEYHAKDIRPSAFALAVFLAVLALGFFSAVHTTTISCRRASEYATARCTIDRTGLRPFHAEVRAEAIERFDVRVVQSKNQRRTAEVRLWLAPTYTPRVVDLETGIFGGGLDLASTLAARERFVRFQAGPLESSYDATLSLPAFLKMLLLLGGALFAGVAGWAVYEQVRQLRPVRIVVDHEHQVVVIGRRTVPFAEVRDVIVEEGVIRAISNRKGERPPGYKISVILPSFDRIAATREWRPGSHGLHEVARQRVLQAMGRVT